MMRPMFLLPPRRVQKICVLCSPLAGTGQEFKDAAVRVGEVLARNKIQLIYGGDNVGLIGAVATTAKSKGGTVLGVESKGNANVYGPNWSEEIKALNRQNKLAFMYQAADAFIILPGGLDTLEELACVTSWSIATSQKKPVGFLNVNGYFNNLFSFLNSAVENGFMFSENKKIIIIGATIEELLSKFECYQYAIGTHTIQFHVIKKDQKEESSSRGLDLNLSL